MTEVCFSWLVLSARLHRRKEVRTATLFILQRNDPLPVFLGRVLLILLTQLYVKMRGTTDAAVIDGMMKFFLGLIPRLSSKGTESISKYFARFFLLFVEFLSPTHNSKMVNG